MCLWWVDIEAKRLHKQSLEGQRQTWQLPERVGCIAITSDCRVVAAMETTIALLSLAANGHVELQTLAHISHPKPLMRFNDGRCDPSGRMWMGSMVMDMGKADPSGGIYALDERGLTGPHLEGLYTPNGLAFSPDGRTMYFSDSHPLSQKIWCCHIDLASGALSDRRLFVDMTDLPGRPDGAATDSKGNYWICANDAGRVHCFDERGQCIESLEVPFTKPAMCAFGGVDLQTMFVTSIMPGSNNSGPLGHSGQVVAAHIRHQGLPEPYFSRFPSTS